MNTAVASLWDTIREVNFVDIDGFYGPLGTPYGFTARMIILQNFTNEPVYFSDDGVNDKFKFFPGTQLVLDYMSNQSGYSRSFAQYTGTQIWVRSAGVAPTSGSVCLSVIYGKGE